MLMGNYILLNLLNHISFIKIRNSGLGRKFMFNWLKELFNFEDEYSKDFLEEYYRSNRKTACFMFVTYVCIFSVAIIISIAKRLWVLIPILAFGIFFICFAFYKGTKDAKAANEIAMIKEKIKKEKEKRDKEREQEDENEENK